MTKPLDVYLGHITTINAKLEQLSKLTHYHFGYDPDDIGWGHVGDLARMEKELDEILSRWVERADRVKQDKRLDVIMEEWGRESSQK